VQENDEDYGLALSLFKSAESSAFGVSSKLDQLKQLLAKGEKIG
jgi:hypothetical protein